MLEDYRCDRCSSVGKCVRSVRITHLPEVLVCHIARFECGLAGQAKKIEQPFSYPHVQVDLCNLVQDTAGPTLYRLHAVVDHFGSLSNGHYVARRQNAEGQWQLLDDDKPAQPRAFSPVPGCGQLTSDSSAYLLVFQRL